MNDKKIYAVIMALSMVLAMAGTVYAAEKQAYAESGTAARSGKRAEKQSYAESGAADGTVGMVPAGSSALKAGTAPGGTLTAGSFRMQDAVIAASGQSAKAPVFSDVHENEWFYPFVQKAAGSGIAEGYGDGTFRPYKTVSYGEFITMAVLHRESRNYKDGKYPGLVKGEHWAATYYYTGLESGYFTEAQVSLRQLDSPIPRKMMAVIAAGMLQGAADDQTVCSYSDVEKSSEYEYYISLCSNAGVLEGYGDGTFRPDGYLKRSEAVKVVVAALEAAENGGSGAAGSGSTGSGSGPGSGQSADYEDPLSQLPPVDLMPQDKRAILEYMLDSLHFGKDEGGWYFSYSQPEIPEAYHLSVRCSLYGPESLDFRELFSWTSDKDYRFHPENYNSAAHTEKQYVEAAGADGLYSLSYINDKSMNFIMRIYDSGDLEEYANFSIYLDPGKSLRLHTAVKMNGDVRNMDEPLPDGVFGW